LKAKKEEIEEISNEKKTQNSGYLSLSRTLPYGLNLSFSEFEGTTAFGE